MSELMPCPKCGSAAEYGESPKGEAFAWIASWVRCVNAVCGHKIEHPLCEKFWNEQPRLNEPARKDTKR